jgi:hypothetical protein
MRTLWLRTIEFCDGCSLVVMAMARQSEFYVVVKEKKAGKQKIENNGLLSFLAVHSADIRT